MAYVRKRGSRWYAVLTGVPGRRGGKMSRALSQNITTKKAALATAYEMQEELDRQKQGLPPTSKKGSTSRRFDDLAGQFLLNKWNLANESTRKTWIPNLENYARRFMQFVNNAPIASISPKQCRAFMDDRMTAGASPSTVRKETTAIKAMFADAILAGELSRNPWDGIKRPSEPIHLERFLTRDEAERLMSSALGNERKFRYLFLLHTGVRKSEALRVQWADVDFNHGRLFIKNAGKGKVSTGRRGVRTVPMSRRLGEALKDWGLDRGPHGKSDRLFGLAWNWPRNIKEDAERAGLGHVRIHDLRHTYGSWLAQAGVHLLQIRDLMGHLSQATTERYAHLAPGQHEEARAALNALGEKKGAAGVPIADVIDVMEAIDER